MPLDPISILEGVLIGIITTLILAIIFNSLWIFKKGNQFKIKFLMAETAKKIKPDDFGLTKQYYKKFYLKRKLLNPESSEDSSSELFIEDIIFERLKNKKDVTIMGKPDSGKTRCAYEVVRKLPSNTIILTLPYEKISIENLNPPVRTWYFKKRHYILFLDDAERYAEADWASDIVSRLKKKNPVTILSTLRKGTEFDRAKEGSMFQLSRFETLLTEQTIIEIPDLTLEQGQDIANEIGVELPPGFDAIRTPGIITVGWDDLKRRYENLDLINPKLLMKAARLLLFAGTFEIKWERLNAAIRAMEKPELTFTDISDAESQLEKEDIIGWDKDNRYVLSGGKVIENIVEDYPSDDTILKHHLNHLINEFEKVSDSYALYNLGVMFGFYRNLESSCNAYEKAVAIKDDLHEAWNNWGAHLAEQAKAVYPENKQEGRELFEETFVKYEKAVAIKDDLHEAWYNWGTHLAELAKAVYPENEQEGRELFEKAFVKYEKAVAIKDDKHEAWYNWGNDLTEQAKAVYPENKQEGRELFEEAFVKYEKAVAIKDDLHEAWNNWGTHLTELAIAVYPENEQEGRELFEEAEEKLTQALKYFDSPKYRGLHGMILLTLEKIDEGIEEKAHAALLCALGGDARMLEYELSTAWSHLEDATPARSTVLKCGVALAVHLRLVKAEQWPDDLLPVLEENMSSLDGRCKLLLNWVKGNGIGEGQTAQADKKDAPIDVLLAFLISTIEKMEHGISEV